MLVVFAPATPVRWLGVCEEKHLNQSIDKLLPTFLYQSFCHSSQYIFWEKDMIQFSPY